MSASVRLKCRCGKVRGVIDPASPSIGRRVVCMCLSCQTYARWLDEAQPALDAHGGSDIYQTTPARVRIEEGHAHVRCVRLSPKGLLRCYAGCCRTPLANMVPAPGMPFVGIPLACLEHAKDTIGPVTMHIHTRCATQPVPADVHDPGKLSLLGIGLGLLVDRVRGQQRPNPFRNDDGTPIHAPEVLSKGERDRIQAQCGPRDRG